MLFTNLDEIRAFLPVGVGNDFYRLKPHIENAEKKYIKPLLGSNMYDELQEFYDTEYPVQPTDVQIATKDLLVKVQHSLIHLAYFSGFDFLNIQASDSGFQRIESERTKGLFKYQEDNLKKYFSDAGFNGLDDVLVFIEENIEYFHEFKLTENYTVLKSSFLPTVKVIENIPFNIHGSRLIFLALKPAVSYIEDTTIKKVLGQTIYAYVKAEMVKDNPDAKVTALLLSIRKPLVYLASAMLMEETGATLDERGLFFEKTDPVYRGNLKKEPSTDQRVAYMVARNKEIGNNYLEDLKSVLNDNWDEYSGQTGSIFRRDNTDKKTFWT